MKARFPVIAFLSRHAAILSPFAVGREFVVLALTLTIGGVAWISRHPAAGAC
jgi:hypothetical protein